MRFKSLVLGALAAACLSSPAAALSCMRPDIAQTMENAKASDDLYYILFGTFKSTPVPKVPRPNKPGPPINGIQRVDPWMNGVGPHRVQARFRGRILSHAPQYDQMVTDIPIDIAVKCAGPWCGGAPANGTDYIAFVKSRAGQPLELTIGACPDKLHKFDSSKRQIETLRSCFDKSCADKSSRRVYH